MSRPKAIVMVTLDCARPDHLGCFGYRGVDTPHIDRLANSGIVYERAIAQAPNTWVSHASIFTGCNPYKHGVRAEHSALAEDVVTLAEALSKAGYATAGFPAHTLVGPARGFGRGFDCYDVDAADFIHTSWETQYYRNWNTMWSKAQAWIEAQTKPIFVWLHYMGTHWEPPEALSLPEDYRHRYSPLGQYFDGKTSWADTECIGGVWRYLEEKSLLDETVFVVVSDHGDDLPGNDPPHRNGGHNKNLFDVVMRIVLIIRAKNWVSAPSRVKEQVRSIDIMPTLLELAQVPIPESVEGRSVLPIHPGADELTIESDTTYAYMENMPRGWLGVRTNEWKLILTDKPPLDSSEKVEVIRTFDRKVLLIDNPERADLTEKHGLEAVVRAYLRAWRVTVRTVARQRRLRMPSWLYTIPRRLYGVFHEVSRRLPLVMPTARGNWKSDTTRDTTQWPFERRVLEEGRVFALYHIPSDPAEQNDVSTDYPEVVEELRDQLFRLTKEAQAESRDVSDADRMEIERRLQALGYF